MSQVNESLVETQDSFLKCSFNVGDNQIDSVIDSYGNLKTERIDKVVDGDKYSVGIYIIYKESLYMNDVVIDIYLTYCQCAFNYKQKIENVKKGKYDISFDVDTFIKSPHLVNNIKVFNNNSEVKMKALNDFVFLSEIIFLSDYDGSLNIANENNEIFLKYKNLILPLHYKEGDKYFPVCDDNALKHSIKFINTANQTNELEILRFNKTCKYQITQSEKKVDFLQGASLSIGNDLVFRMNNQKNLIICVFFIIFICGGLFWWFFKRRFKDSNNERVVDNIIRHEQSPDNIVRSEELNDNTTRDEQSSDNIVNNEEFGEKSN